MADRTRAKYYLVEAGVLPEVFIKVTEARELLETCLLYTSPSPRD